MTSVAYRFCSSVAFITVNIFSTVAATGFAKLSGRISVIHTKRLPLLDAKTCMEEF